ncbi:caspase-1-like [Andrena cerasifolii]|uniref:caspase-1-like n=1 Tax=Andrena cerasifolii TaxID=2819439 RepID=UPI004037EB1E
MNENREKKAEASFGKNQSQPKQEDRESVCNGNQGKQTERQPKVGEVQREVKDKLLRILEKQQKMDEMQPKMVDKQSTDPIASTSSTLEPTNVDGWLFQKPKYDDFVPDKPALVEVHVDSEVYKMNHKRRGVALIFNHVYFKKMPARTGSIKDCSDLQNVLQALDFEVQVYTDPTTRTIGTVLKSTAAEDHTDADCLIVVAMSHGESGFLHSFDFKYPVEMLWAHFTGDKCSSLIGKPKLFFIQACRGTRLDAGSQVVHERDGVDSYSIPTYADILVAYSTYDGFYSWRNPDAGAWFIQALCNELEKNGRTRDLLTILTFVNRRVAIDYKSYVPQDKDFNMKKQIPSFVSMLTRLVHFPEKPL